MARAIHRLLFTSSAFLIILLFVYVTRQNSFVGEARLSIREISIEDAQRALANGTFTSVDLVNTYLARIDEINDHFHAVTEVNQEALDVARSLDLERAATGPRGPLHGIPILLKDSIAALSMNNTLGSYALIGATTKRDASVVDKLKKAGAIILGKANLSQWGNLRSSNSSNGWSAYGGHATGIMFSKQDPCGSSSGSATAVALGLAMASVGVETYGSIICPAEKANLVAIKPTVGLVSRDLVMVSKHLGTVGPLARTVKDAALMLYAMAGKCSRDSNSEQIPFDVIPNYVSACRENALMGARLGVPRNVLKGNSCGQTTPTVLEAFEKSFSTLASGGAVVVDNTNFTDYDEYLESDAQGIVSNAFWKAALLEYLGALEENPNDIKSVSDLIDFTKSHPLEEYPSRNIASWLTAEKSPATDSEEVQQAIRELARFGGVGGIRGAMERSELDALILPTVVGPIVPAIIGYPVVTVPLAFYPEDQKVLHNDRGDLVLRGPGSPIGLSFIGLPFSEEKLVGYAYAFEQMTKIGKTRKPYLLPTVEVPRSMRPSRGPEKSEKTDL